MIIRRLRIQFKRENINIRIKRSSILFFHVNQIKIYDFKPCLAISLEIAIPSDQEFCFKTATLKFEPYSAIDNFNLTHRHTIFLSLMAHSRHSLPIAHIRNSNLI